MRDRLIELFKQADEKAFEYICENDHMDFIPTKDEIAGVYADHFLANGVIVPPCKVGDKVYVADYTRLGYMVFECTIEEISHYTYGTFYYLNWGLHIPRFKACKEDSFGKTVFLTCDEAEKALKEAKG